MNRFSIFKLLCIKIVVGCIVWVFAVWRKIANFIDFSHPLDADSALVLASFILILIIPTGNGAAVLSRYIFFRSLFLDNPIYRNFCSSHIASYAFSPPLNPCCCCCCFSSTIHTFTLTSALFLIAQLF